MTKCLIIGGGFAGLSAACFLADKGIKVHLLEASPKLGGRAYSFTHETTLNNNSTSEYKVDNGQHILMGCYNDTIKFLKLIGAEGNITFQNNLEINFIKRGGALHKLDASKLFYPFNLLRSIINYSAVSIRERLSIIRLFIKIFFINSKKYKNINLENWLREEKQSEDAVKSLWEILIVGTLNTTPQKASAEIFINILKKMFFTGNKSTVIVLPNTGLSEIYCADSKKFIEKKGGIVSVSEKINEIVLEENKVVKIISNKSQYSDFDFVISAVPLHAFIKYINDPILIKTINDKIEYSPILTVHLWLKENPFDEKFYGLINSKIHWLFNHGSYITLVTSAADEFINMGNHDILKIFYSELGNYFPIFYENLVKDYLILKEKRATFVPTVELSKLRKNLKFPYTNLFIAGDWINSELPSTIEGSVLSGRIAADSVFSNI